MFFISPRPQKNKKIKSKPPTGVEPLLETAIIHYCLCTSAQGCQGSTSIRKQQKPPSI